MIGTHDHGFDVSRETLEALQEFSELLLKWNKSINLIARGEEANLWHRHIQDSLQLVPMIPDEATSLMDLGSGAGFPGLVCAIAVKNRVDFSTTLVESDQRKCAFLGVAVRSLGLDVTVANRRIESLAPTPSDVIMARALAPVGTLLHLSERHLKKTTVALFLKGANAETELTEAARHWHTDVERIASVTDPSGVILKITSIGRRQ